jgi:hypothetical protein
MNNEELEQNKRLLKEYKRKIKEITKICDVLLDKIDQISKVNFIYDGIAIHNWSPDDDSCFYTAVDKEYVNYRCGEVYLEQHNKFGYLVSYQDRDKKEAKVAILDWIVYGRRK